jgi:hypothetical protein
MHDFHRCPPRSSITKSRLAYFILVRTRFYVKKIV